MADLGTEFELGEGSVILIAVIVIGYFVYKGGGSLASVLSSVGSSIKDAAGGLKPTQTLPSVPGCFQVYGTGQTVSQLLALGYTKDQINQMLAQNAQSGGPILVQPIPTGTVGPPNMPPTPGMTFCCNNMITYC